MSSDNATSSTYQLPLPDLFGNAVATGSAKQRRSPRTKKPLSREFTLPLLELIDPPVITSKPKKLRKMPQGVINQPVRHAPYVGAAPRVEEIDFKHFTCDANNRILYDEGDIFFSNGWGARVRRHYEHHGRENIFVYYSVAVRVLFRGGHHEFSYKHQFPEDAPIVADNFRQIFPKAKVDNPYSYTENDKEILEINAFLRRVQHLWRNSKAPERRQVKSVPEQRNIKEGLPQKLKPALREPKLDL